MTIAKPAEDDQPSVVEQLADDAAPPAEYPPGTPELRPLLDVRPRSRRGELKRKVADALEAVAGVKKAEAAAKKIKDEDARNVARARMWADADDMLDLLDQVLALAAVDDAAYRAWSDTASDDALMQAFGVYQRRAQPGEAPGSTS